MLIFIYMSVQIVIEFWEQLDKNKYKDHLREKNSDQSRVFSKRREMCREFSCLIAKQVIMLQ